MATLGREINKLIWKTQVYIEGTTMHLKSLNIYIIKLEQDASHKQN